MAGHLTRDLEQGAVAGIVATVPMTITMLAVHRCLPHHERYPLPPEKITAELAERAGVTALTAGNPRTLAAGAAHLAYGALTGALYNATVSRASHHPLVGSTYGLAVWSVSYLGLLPVLGILKPATQHPWRRNGLMLLSHVVWGLALSKTLRVLSTDCRPRSKLEARRSSGRGRESSRANAPSPHP